jgi:hypothetical protein
MDQLSRLLSACDREAASVKCISVSDLKRGVDLKAVIKVGAEGYVSFATMGYTEDLAYQ